MGSGASKPRPGKAAALKWVAAGHAAQAPAHDPDPAGARAGTAYSPRVLAALDAIAAVVEFNQISLEESYEAFDTDEDDKLSLPDLQAAVHTLGLDIPGDAVLELFAALDPAGMGHIRSDVWSDVQGCDDHWQKLDAY